MSIASWRLSLQAWLALLGLGISLWLIVSYGAMLLNLIWVLFGAFLLSLAIRPLVDTLARRRIPRGLTVVGVYLALLALLVGLGTLLVPVVGAKTLGILGVFFAVPVMVVLMILLQEWRTLSATTSHEGYKRRN